MHRCFKIDHQFLAVRGPVLRLRNLRMSDSDARIIDQHVQRWEFGDDLFGQGYPVRLSGNITLDGLQGWRLTLRGGEWLGATAADDDVVASGDEALSEGQADAGAAARDALKALEEDYARMVEDGLLLEDADPFETLMARCANIAERANRAGA